MISIGVHSKEPSMGINSALSYRDIQSAVVSTLSNGIFSRRVVQCFGIGISPGVFDNLLSDREIPVATIRCECHGGDGGGRGRSRRHNNLRGNMFRKRRPATKSAGRKSNLQYSHGHNQLLVLTHVKT